jgi:intermembrane space import and assembly protein 40
LPTGAIKRLDESIHHIQESNLPTVDAVVEEKRRRQAEEAAAAVAAAEEHRKQQSIEAVTPVEEGEGDATDSDEEEGMGGLEEEAGQQGAFNPETGEINWDCPCLGGMAHGPCGEEFKEAFSCFVYSKEEPKGVECIEKFKCAYPICDLRVVLIIWKGYARLLQTASRDVRFRVGR